MMRRAGFMMAVVCMGGVLTGCTGGGQPQEKQDVEAATGHFGTSADRPEETVPLSSIKILRTVLKDSPNYTIDSSVKLDAYYYTFTIHTPHGDYEVRSVRNLVKTLREIDVIERFRQTDNENHVWTGVTQSARGIGVGAKNLVLHPGQSLKRVGEGTARFFRWTGNMFKGGKQTQASDGTDRALLGRGPAGSERRLIAAELGIDVYTDTPIVQEILNEVARKRLAGKLPLSASVFALPGGLIFTMSLTPMGFDPSTEELIRDKDPDELVYHLSQTYAHLFAYVPEEDNPATRLLNNPNFTPREKAYITRYMTDLKAVEGRDEALQFLAEQYSPDRAGIVTAQLEMLSLVNERARPIQKFVPLRNTLGALARDKTLIFIISNDTIRFWSDVKTSLNLAKQAAESVGARRVEFWTTGDVDQQSVNLAYSMGVSVYQDILSHPLFRIPRGEEWQRQKGRYQPLQPSRPTSGTALQRAPSPETVRQTTPRSGYQDLRGNLFDEKSTAPESTTPPATQRGASKSRVEQYW